MDRRVTPPRRVTSPTWVPPSPCKQALTPPFFINLWHICKEQFFFSFSGIKKDKLNFMSKWHLIQSLQREMYKKLTLIVFNVFKRTLSLGAPGLSPRFSSGAKIFGHVSHSTELVRMCLACQHFDFNSADWISDNLHVISSWYLRTMGKEFIFRFSRR